MFRVEALFLIANRLLQQVTADLYGILLIVFESPDGTNRCTGIKVLGDFAGPHRFLLFNNGSEYNPLIPAVAEPNKYQFPDVTLANTILVAGVSEGIDRSLDGPFHPWRTPIPGEPAPSALVPTPVNTTTRLSREALETVLWVNIHAETAEQISSLEAKKYAAAKRFVTNYEKRLALAKQEKERGVVKAEEPSQVSQGSGHSSIKKFIVENEGT